MTIVIKFGGNALAGLEPFAHSVVALAERGLAPVIAHGGGPQIDAMLTRLAVPSAGRHLGLRITTPEVMDVARLVLRGQVGPAIVTAINAAGGSAVALAGDDGRMLTAQTRDPALGLVGDVTAVRPDILHALTAAGHVPVVAPIAPDAAGVAHNVNADSIAAALAIGLRADKLVMLTDVPGLYRSWPDPDSLIGQLDTDELEALLPSLETGMIPKMKACLDAVRGGVPSAHVLDGRDGAWAAALSNPAALSGPARSAGTTVTAALTGALA